VGLTGLALLFLLAPIVEARHIIEGPIGEIAEATEAVTRLDQEAANPMTTPARREEVQAARAQQVEQISRVAAANPQSEQVNIAAANSLLRVSEPVRAEQAAERAVALAPQNPDTYLLRGRARMENRDYDAAVADFREALRLRPGDRAAIGFLKLSEGRTAVGAKLSGNVSAGPPPPGALSAADVTAAERKRRETEALSHYNDSVIAQGRRDWERAKLGASRALELAPDSLFFKRHMESLAAAHHAAENPQPQVSPKMTEPSPIASGAYLEGFLHYLGKSKRTRRIDFNQVDTSHIRVTEFPAVKAELAKPGGKGRVTISSKKGWNARGGDAYLIGRGLLLLKGTFTHHEDCRWSFEGSLRSYDDDYNFNKDRRGPIAEAMTTLGRMVPGKEYSLEIRGTKPIRDAGTKENCR
jgi:tetratricopeptide (TPR) repeat protein